MLILLHGDDIANSRLKLDELTKSEKWKENLDATKNEFKDIVNLLEKRELFQDQRLVVIEKLFSLKGSSFKNALDAVKNYGNIEGLSIILWEDKILTTLNIKKLADAKVLSFSLPKYYYLFLDSIAPSNGKKLHGLLIQLSTQLTDEQLFYSIVKRVRILLMLKQGAMDNPEVSFMMSWQISKLKSQEKLWDEDKLISFYKKLFEMERDLKTSQLPLSLTESIDILLLSQLY